MTVLFTAILNMSITASVVALFVILIRLSLRKAPKIYSYVLWGAVLFRLLCPFSFNSDYSLMPKSVNVIPQDIIFNTNSEIQNILYVNYVSEYQANASNRDSLLNDLPLGYSPVSRHYLQTVFGIALYVWPCGVVILLIYAIMGYERIRKRVFFATLVRENIYETDQIKAPFVLGFIRPKIYIPVTIDSSKHDYIIKHEKSHIRRRDYLIKPVIYFALALHWFNPLVWLCYCLISADMEMSCDEDVIKKSDVDIRYEYTTLLLDLSTQKTGFVYPLAFGERNVKSRIRNVLYYKKPTVFITVVSILAVVMVLGGFSFNPDSSIFGEEIIDKLEINEIASISIYAVPPNISTQIYDNEKIIEIVNAIKTFEISNSYFPVSDTEGNFTNFIINTNFDEMTTIGIYESYIAINGQWYIANDEACERLESLVVNLIGPAIDIKPHLNKNEETKIEPTIINRNIFDDGIHQ